MPAPFLLASASDVVNVWDIHGNGAADPHGPEQLVPPPHARSTLKPHKQSIHTLQWNHNNGVLGSGSSDGTIALSDVNDGRVIRRLPESSDDAAPAPVVSLSMSSGSRYLCSAGGAEDANSHAAGGAATVVSIWDLKKNTRSRRLVGHSAPVTAIDLASSDQHVASCSTGGEILVHSLSQAILTCKLVSPAVAAAASGSGNGGGIALRDCQHSPHRKNFLAACGDSGVVELWDCNTSSLTATLRPPPLSGGSPLLPLVALRFSPANSALAASIGLDRRLCFFDTASARKCIRDISGDYVFSALDFHTDGVTLATGTTSGHILMYDIRKADKPLCKILNAHAGRSVNVVKFAHALASTPSSSGASGAAAAAAKVAAANAAGVYDAKASTFIDSTDHTSTRPGQQAHSAQSHNATLPASSLNHSTLSQQQLTNQTVPASYSSGGGDLFSPVKDIHAAPATLLSPANGYTAAAPTSARGASGAGSLPAGLSFMSPTAPPSHLSSYPAAASRPAHLSTTASPKGARAAALDQPHASPHSSPAASSAAAFAALQPPTAAIAAPSPTSSHGVLTLAQPHRSSSTSSPIAGHGSRSASQSFGSSGPLSASAPSASGSAGVSDAQLTLLLRSLLDDSLQSLRADMRAQMTDLHVEMLKQFHLQSQEQTRAMDAFTQRFEEMVAEVRALKDEYQQLRHIY